MNKKLNLKLYVDASFFEDKEYNSKYGIGAYYCDLEFIISKTEHKHRYLYDKINLGILKDSAMAEFISLEKTLEKIIQILKKKYKLSTKKLDIKIFTDHQTMAKQFRKVVAPPVDKKLSACFRRINELLKNFKNYRIDWVDRKENKAGKLLEKYLKEKKENNNINFTTIDTKVLLDLEKKLDLEDYSKPIEKINNNNQTENKKEIIEKIIIPKKKITLELTLEEISILQKILKKIEDL